MTKETKKNIGYAMFIIMLLIGSYFYFNDLWADEFIRTNFIPDAKLEQE